MKKTVENRLKKTGEVLSCEAHNEESPLVPPALLGDLRTLIESARIRVAVGVNAEMVMLYWDIGERINKEILGDKRAVYGKKVINTLSEDLVAHYGPGFARTNLFNMIRFAEVFPDRSTVHSLEWTIKLDPFQEYHLC